MSPEIAEGIIYSKKVDVYNFGCLAYELATGMPPFAAKIQSQYELLYHIKSTKVPDIDPSKWS